jgi:hypothetical protein
MGTLASSIVIAAFFAFVHALRLSRRMHAPKRENNNADYKDAHIFSFALLYEQGAADS